MKTKKISQSFQRWLLVVVVIAFLVTTTCLWLIQTKLSERNAIDLLKLNISDVRQDILDASDENLLALAHQVAGEINRAENPDSGLLLTLIEKYDLAEANIINSQGIITATTHDPFLGYDMATGAQSAEFMVLLQGEEEYAQSYQPTSSDGSLSRKYGGVTLAGGGFVQVGYDAARFQRDIDAPIPGGAISCYTLMFLQLGIPLEAISLAVAANVVLDFTCTAGNLHALLVQLAHGAKKLGMLDETILLRQE